jgi:hypothetical protein
VASGRPIVITTLYLLFAGVHLLLWLWGWRAWHRRGRPVALALVLVPATLLWYDNLRIGLGRFLGEGPLLHAISVPAFVWHWTLLPVFVVAAFSLARSAGLAWAKRRLAMGAFVAVTVALIAADVPYALGLVFGPIGPLPDVELRLGCIADAIRYTATLSATFACGPETEIVRTGPGPLVAILMNVVVLGVGVALWRSRGWPWLALAAGTMFVAAAGLPLWGVYGPPVANLGEIAFVAGLLATGVRFADASGPSPDQ